MILAGLQKLSLVDYPGHICSIVFTQGCDFRCPYCQNPDLVSCERKFACEENDIIEFLRNSGGVVEGVVITGGEPLIYKDLPVFIEKVRATGKKVKLDTNGSNPGLLAELIDGGKIDYISLDVKTALSRYDLVADIPDISSRVEESIKMIMGARVEYEIRTTCVPGIVGEKELLDIGEKIKGADRWRLQQFRPGITLEKGFEKVKPYRPDEMRSFKQKLAGYAKDVDIRGI